MAEAGEAVTTADTVVVAVMETTGTQTPKSDPPSSDAKKTKTSKSRRVVRRKKTSTTTPTSNSDEIPPHISNNAQLQHAISTSLPDDYEFEILKTLWRVEKSNAKHVALQMPEGLLMYASVIADIILKFSKGGKEVGGSKGLSVSVLGDVTYGACCVDDLNAQALGCDLLVHYGHSCLVPLTATVVPCLYVFVEIRVDVDHLVECFRRTYLDAERVDGVSTLMDGTHIDSKDGPESKTTAKKVVETCVMGTVQFRSAVVEAARRLNEDAPSASVSSSSTTPCVVRFRAFVPQAKPLSPGEVLGCTAPSGLAELDFDEVLTSKRDRRKIKANAPSQEEDATPANVHDPAAPVASTERVMLFLADGRFHLEAAMIANPTLRALRYDPYSKTLTDERYEVRKMKEWRRKAVESVRTLVNDAQKRCTVIPSNTMSSSIGSSDRPPTVGIVLGTLGRQGNPAVLQRLRTLLTARRIRSVVILLSEIFPAKLELMSDSVDAWVQVACPRLSVDWGHFFRCPVLNSYELHVALGVAKPFYTESKVEAEDKEDDDGMGDDGPVYPMDFYSVGGGTWTNYHPENRARKIVA